MESYFSEYSDLVAAWPNPVLLKYEHGEVFLMITLGSAYIESRWFGHVSADDIVTGAKVYLELLKKTPHPKLLNDKSAATGDWEDANDWLEYEWLPKAMAAGLKCFAHVYSENVFSKLSARNLYLRVVPNLQMENFLHRRDAIKWLASCNMPANASETTT